MLTKHEKARFANETRKVSKQVWELRDSVAKVLPECYHYYPGPCADLYRAYQLLAEIAAKFEGK